MARKRRQRSLGEMISTVCFYAVGIFFLLEANLMQEEGEEMMKVVGMYIAGGLCVLAGARFVIGEMVTRWWGGLS